jgi:hypothetical protein
MSGLTPQFDAKLTSATQIEPQSDRLLGFVDHPLVSAKAGTEDWIPAFAGMSGAKIAAR